VHLSKDVITYLHIYTRLYTYKDSSSRTLVHEYRNQIC